MINNYGKEQIKTLEGIEAIRLRPGVYIGSIEQEGVHHIALEIISNSIDEYLNGQCTECCIEINNNNYISIEDNGRGVPFGKAKDGSETLVNVFTKLHTGAKFDSSGKTGYNSSGGMNGLGSKATNALASEFKVISIREGKRATASFKKGKLISYKEEKINNKDKHGTFIQFKPDEEIFKTTIEIDYNWIKKTLTELSYLSPGLTFKFKYKDKPEELITSKEGIKDYMIDLFKKKKPVSSMFYAKSNEGQIGVELAMQYNDSFSDTYKLFTNNIPNTGGTHLTGFRTALTQAINEYAKEHKLLKEKDSNLTGEELKEGLTLVLSFIMPDPVFSGQTKEVLTSGEARTIVQRLVSKELKVWLNTHASDAKAIIEKALLARTVREKAKKAKDAARNINKKNNKNNFLNLPTKLVDCWSKDRLECELFLTEGDSAAGGLTEARDAEFQAVFPVRGKIISARKASAEKLLANQEVVGIIKALGLDFDAKKIKLEYDPKKLRYGRLMLAADGDADGRAIKNLFLTLFWELCPELVINGHIWATMPPLFRITTKKNEYIFLKDEKALEEYKEKHLNEQYLINRNKGYEEVWPLSIFPLASGVA